MVTGTSLPPFFSSMFGNPGRVKSKPSSSTEQPFMFRLSRACCRVSLVWREEVFLCYCGSLENRHLNRLKALRRAAFEKYFYKSLLKPLLGFLPGIGPVPTSSSDGWYPPGAGWTWPRLDQCSSSRESPQTSHVAASTYKMGVPKADPAKET